MRVFALDRSEYQCDDHPLRLWCLGTCHSITQVNGRSFYAYAKGRRQRRLRVEWRQWLARLQRGARLWLLRSERDPAGWQQLRALQPDPMDQAGAMAGVSGGLDQFEIDQRMQRALRQVLPRYQLVRSDRADGLVVVEVSGGAQPYEVRAPAAWSEPPQCSCPDALHRRPLHGGFCKHALAVLLRWPDLRCQLLDAIL